jgi:hypothetical protein
MKDFPEPHIDVLLQLGTRVVEVDIGARGVFAVLPFRSRYEGPDTAIVKAIQGALAAALLSPMAVPHVAKYSRELVCGI